MMVRINGQDREFPVLTAEAKLTDLIAALGLKGDRIAVEHNGAIVARSAWSEAPVVSGDRFEVVHFVGGGLH